MAKRAVEHEFTGDTVAYDSYSHTKTVLGPLILKKTGVNPTDNFAGPAPLVMARPMEASTGIASQYPHAINWSSTIDWIFLAEMSTAGATRRVVKYEYNKSTQELNWNGFITLTYPPNTAHTVRGLRVVRHTYTTGTVTVSGTAVTGSGSAWTTARIAAGARIGFGATDPTQVTTWYYISSIGGNTSITLTGSADTIASPSSYVIEELRVYTSTTNATPANGGLFVAKGINADDFAAGGTVIAAATTTDNLKAVYWLADASTVLNIAAGGLAISPTVSDTSHIMYVVNADAGTTMRIYKYDGRAALSGLSSGKSTSAFVLRTGQATVSGTISQTNAGRIATTNHGPGNGVSCLYTVTTTRILRIVESGITDASTAFVTDAMSEIPTGSANTFAATAGLTSIEYTSSIDRFFVTTGASQRNYLTQYDTSGVSFDHVLLSDSKQLDHSISDSGTSPYPTTTSGGFSVWIEGGIAYLARTGTTSIINQLYVLPIAVQWDYAVSTNNRLITPSLSTSGATRYYRVYINSERLFGSDNLGIPPEPFRLYYRTSGIADNSGSWTLVGETGNLSSVTAVSAIQFMFEFRICGLTAAPARIFNLSLTYEDDTTDSHFQPSVGFSDVANKRFAWRFSSAFGGTVPTLQVRIYDADSGNLLVDDVSDTPTGTWQKSTDDGQTWGDYNNTDLSNTTTYIRYTPASLGNDIKVRALLTQE